MGRDMLKNKFSDRNVVLVTPKYVDPGKCLAWQNHGDQKRDIYSSSPNHTKYSRILRNIFLAQNAYEYIEHP